jgi:hypothetical protein
VLSLHGVDESLVPLVAERRAAAKLLTVGGISAAPASHKHLLEFFPSPKFPIFRICNFLFFCRHKDPTAPI